VGSVGGALLGAGPLAGADELAAALEDVPVEPAGAGAPADPRAGALVAGALWWCRAGCLLFVAALCSGTTTAAGTPLCCRTVVTGFARVDPVLAVVGVVPAGACESAGSR